MLILAVVIGVVLAWHLWAERSWQRERQRLLNVIVARNAHELAGLDSASRAKPRARKDREPVPEQVGL